MVIIFIGLVILNWILYHKLFRVVYFNLGAGLFKEFAACIFLAGIELALFAMIGPWLVGLAIIIAVIIAMRKYIKKKEGEKPILEDDDEENLTSVD